MNKIKLIEAKYMKKDTPEFNVGDTVKVMTRIFEVQEKEKGKGKSKDKDKDKERVRLHPFEGVVIAKGGSGINANFTVRRVSYGEGIERVFPLNSPGIERIEVIRSGKVRRAKLYYLRGKIGKRASKIEAQEKEETKPA
ncbi:MAG: 50S ribosomal protein L19 [Deltaproteobacteria bacterium]